MNSRLSSSAPLAMAALAGLAVLVLLMFIAMLVGIEPHPPAARGPYLAAVLALLTAAWLLLSRGLPAGRWAGLLAALFVLPSVGPHKFWTEPAAAALAPLIAVGTLAVLTVLVTLARAPVTAGERRD